MEVNIAWMEPSGKSIYPDCLDPLPRMQLVYLVCPTKLNFSPGFHVTPHFMPFEHHSLHCSNLATKSHTIVLLQATIICKVWYPTVEPEKMKSEENGVLQQKSLSQSLQQTNSANLVAKFCVVLMMLTVCIPQKCGSSDYCRSKVTRECDPPRTVIQVWPFPHG